MARRGSIQVPNAHAARQRKPDEGAEPVSHGGHKWNQRGGAKHGREGGMVVVEVGKTKTSIT
jgi:hypothetical protein